MQCFVQALDSCVYKAIFGHWSCHAKNRLDRHVHIKKTHLKNMTSYQRVKSATAGPVTDTYFECLFYFDLKSENTGIISRLQWYMRNNSIFSFYIYIYFLFQFLMSIDSWVNSSRIH